MIESRSSSTSLRVHCTDASEHLRLAARSLEAAATVVVSERSARRLQGLAEKFGEWAIRIDPRIHGQRERRAR